jgi:DNA polymerase kappa
VCSDINKPDGQYCLQPSRDAVMSFVATLPVRKVPGIGRVTEQTLSALGVTSCAQMLSQRGLLSKLFSAVALEFFLAAALGLGGTRHSDRPGGHAAAGCVQCSAQ